MSTISYDPPDFPKHAMRRSGDPHDPDPFDQMPSLAPNAGQDVLPHVVTFQGLLRNVARCYYPSDEAIRDCWDHARFMRNDPGIMECLEQRKRSTALLGWHLECEDEKDPTQKMLCEELTAMIKTIPNFLKYRENLLDALWYGKYAVAHRYRWKKVRGQMRIAIDKWRPVNGDKLVFRYDDGSGEFDEDQVGIRVGQGFTEGSQVAKRWKVERINKVAATDQGLAYFLEHWERPLLAIHKHQIEDGAFEAPELAGSIHGVGIRSRIYWMWYQKQETLAWLMEYLERSAFGIEIWSYPAGNPQAKEETKTAAMERIGNGRNIVLVPRHPDSDVLSTDVKRIEPGMAGADILDRILREYFGWQIKRYILGQILTSETASTGLGSGVATIHLDTYLQIVKYDATNLQETLTTDLVAPLLKYNWPQYADLPIRFAIETESPDVEGKLRGWKQAYEMGLKIRAQDVADLIGAAVAKPNEEVLQNPQHVQAAAAQQQMAQQQQQLAQQQAAAQAERKANEERVLSHFFRGEGAEPYRKRRLGRARGRYVERYGTDGWKDQPRDEEGKWTKGGGSSSGSENWQDAVHRAIRDLLQAPSRTSEGQQAVEYGPVSEEEAARLLAQTGLDLRGYTHMIDKSAINHIFKNHGVGREWRQQHIPVTEEDILRVPEIVANPDSSKKLPQKSRDIECIEHKKRDDGITFIVEEVRTGKKRLALKSIHKVTTGAAGATAKEAGVRQTSETLPDKSPEKIIDPNGGEVKGKSREDYRAAAPKHEPGWRTVGGGARVYIGKDGRIEAGCPGLKTEDIDEIGEDESPEHRNEREHRMEVAEHHGLDGEELTQAEVKQLEAAPHPETGHNADGQPAGTPEPTRDRPVTVEIDGKPYEVSKIYGMWFFRRPGGSDWTVASSAMVHLLQGQGRQVPNAEPAHAEPEDDVPFDVPPEDTQPPTRAKINPRSRVGQAILQTAQDWGVAPDDLADALEYVWEQRAATGAYERQKALEAARKLTGLRPYEVKRLKNAGYDHTSAKRIAGQLGQRLARFDEFAQEIAREYPVLGLGNPDDPSNDFAARLWEILDEDRATVAPIDDPDLLREAAHMVLVNQQAAEQMPTYATWEEFRRHSEVKRYRRWLAERYAKPAKGQRSFDWDEADHPRKSDGTFAPKGGGDEGESVEDPAPPTPEEQAKYDEYVKAMTHYKLTPRRQEAWLQNYRTVQARIRRTAQAAEKPIAPEPAPEDQTLDLAGDTTPREAAGKVLEKQIDTEYAFARQSAIPNAGEDVLGSARHKANAWRGLEEAERDGTAEELVTRDKLLKNEPHALVVHVHRNPLATLAMYFALRAFPGKPGYGSRRPSPEEAKKNRAQYLDAYRRVKAKAEDLAAGEEDPRRASRALGSFVGSLILEYRGQTDRYNATANALCSLQQRLASPYQKTSITRQADEFAKAFDAKYGQDLDPEEKRDRLADHVADVLDGASLNKTLGRESTKQPQFNPADLYVKVATREGGRVLPFHSGKQAVEYMTSKQKFRGVQFGNSVTDEEREHHAKKCAEAMSDLADVLGIPDEYVSWKGRLAIAFGARGKGNAVAHYEPVQQVINLTRKSGVGSLAHEWGHFFDHMLAGGEVLQSSRGGREAVHFSDLGPASYEYKDGKSSKVDHTQDPMWRSFDRLRQAWESSGFRTRLTAELRTRIREGQMSQAKANYWLSNTEMFARTFERYVQRRLESVGHKNTYLAGIETKAYKEGGLWPTDKEVDAMEPAFDGIFQELADGIDKGRYWLREVGERLVLERRSPLAEQFAKAFETRGFVVRYSQSAREAVEEAAAETERNPSEAQKEAGNYRKGKCRLFGLDIAIETPQGAIRSGRDRQGNAWSITMPYHYGYLKRTESEADGDHIDVFLGPHLDSELVFVVDQVQPESGRFDEHKVMLGWTSAEEAKDAYHACYTEGWKGFEAITPMTLPQFKQWLETGDSGRRIAEQAGNW